MNPDDIRGALIRAVPPLTAPPQRMAEVSGRIRRRHNRRFAVAVVAAALAAGTLVGTRLLLPVAGTYSSGVVADGGSPAPSDSAPAAPPPTTTPRATAPGTTTPGTTTPGPPGSDGVGVGRCPATLDLTSQSEAVVAGSADVGPALPLARVTLCRYRQANFNWSVGPATRLAGPREGTPDQFGTPVNEYVQQRIWRAPSSAPPPPSPGASPPTGGCRYPSPYTDISVEVVYTVDAHGVARQYRVGRISCAAGSDPDPARQLEAVVDRVLGPPY